jgi:hypothetical protein
MSERKLAPHVARAIGAAQAKPEPAAGAASRAPAPHLSRALAPGASPQARPAGERPGPAAHVRQAVARGGLQQKAQPAASPAPHVAAAMARPAPDVRGQAPRAGAARGALQRMELSTQEAKKLAQKQKQSKQTRERSARLKSYLEIGIGEVHQDLEKPFFKAFTSGPVQDFKVGIEGLETSPLKVGEDLSQLSNFSTSIKEIYDAKPEVQTAIVRDKTTNQIRVKLSTNFNSKNKLIRRDTGGATLKTYYKELVRPSHVVKRQNSVKSHLRRLKDGEIVKVLDETLEKVKDKSEFDKTANLKLAKIGHQGSKTGEVRRRLKSARRFSLRSEYSDVPIEVVDNPFNFHSESAILDECISKNEELRKVIGTKVPCLACKAHFAGKSVPELLLRHTSFGWVSTSSMKQLGRSLKGTISQKDVTWYLNHLHEKLGGSELKAYSVSSGEISIQDLTVRDDSSDSEDEEAQTKYDYRTIGDIPLEKKSSRKRKQSKVGGQVKPKNPPKKKRKVEGAENRDRQIKELVENFKKEKLK